MCVLCLKEVLPFNLNFIKNDSKNRYFLGTKVDILGSKEKEDERNREERERKKKKEKRKKKKYIKKKIT